MDNPIISVSRQHKKIAIFDGYNIVRMFEAYTDEQEAIAEAKAWVAAKTTNEPTLAYPVIKKMRMST